MRDAGRRKVNRAKGGEQVRGKQALQLFESTPLK